MGWGIGRGPHWGGLGGCVMLVCSGMLAGGQDARDNLPRELLPGGPDAANAGVHAGAQVIAGHVDAMVLASLAHLPGTTHSSTDPHF